MPFQNFGRAPPPPTRPFNLDDFPWGGGPNAKIFTNAPDQNTPAQQATVIRKQDGTRTVLIVCISIICFSCYHPYDLFDKIKHSKVFSWWKAKSMAYTALEQLK